LPPNEYKQSPGKISAVIVTCTKKFYEMAMDKKGTGYKVKLTYICGHKEMNKMYG
jgi:hypothetical protein